MTQASINLTIDLGAFQQSLTAAFNMYQATLKAMGQDSPKVTSKLTAELDKLASQVQKPLVLQADGTPFSAAVNRAETEIAQLDSKAESSVGKIRGWWDAHKQTLSEYSLIYRGVMDVYNDITRVFGGMINQQIEAQKGMARVEAAVRSSGAAAGFTAEQLKGLAGDMEEAFAIDADDIMNQVTTPLLTFRSLSGEVFTSAQEQVINMSRALGMDLQGAAMQVGKALQDPVEGLTALRRSGVSFTDQQQEMIQGMYEAGDAAGAQKLILEELNAEFGGQAAAYMETGAGKLEALKVAFDNLSESIGGVLLPVITGLGAVVKPLVEWFSNLDDAFKILIPALVLATAAWYKYSVAQTATATISGALTGAIAAASAAVQGFLVAVGPVGWVLMGVTAAVTAWTVVKGRAKEKTDELSEAQKGLREEIKGAQNEVSVESERFNQLSTRLLELNSSANQTVAVKTEMKNIIRTLNDKYGEYLGNVNLERLSYDQLKTSLAAANDELVRKMTVVSYEKIVQGHVDALAKAKTELAGKLDELMNVSIVPTASNFMTVAYEQLKMLEGRFSDWNKNPMYLAIRGLYDQVKNEIDALNNAQAAYQVALGNMGTISAPKPKGGGPAPTPTTEDSRKQEAERLMAELARLRQSETEQIAAEYEKRKALILQYTADGSTEEKKALEDLDAWKTGKEAEITAREKAGIQEKFQAEVDYLANLQEMGVSSYGQLKAKMDEYYEWAKTNLPAEEAALVEAQMREANLRWGAHQKEKEEKERAHQRTLADIRAEWNGRNLSLEEQDLNAQLVELERQFADEKALMIEAGMTEAQITEMYQQKRWKITNDYNMKIAESTSQHMMNGAAGMSKAFGLIAGAQDKETKRGFKTWQRMAIAQGMVDTFSAALGAFKSMVGIPVVGPVLAAAAASAAIYAGMKNVDEIRSQKYEPPQAAEGGYLEGPGHDRGGVMIEAEGGEYITRKSRVAALGKGIFDFINNGPIEVVRKLFAGMALPAIQFNQAMASEDGGGSYSFAGGGRVSGSNAVTSLLGSLDEKLGRLLEKKVAFDIHIDPFDSNPVKVSEIAELGDRIRGAF